MSAAITGFLCCSRFFAFLINTFFRKTYELGGHLAIYAARCVKYSHSFALCAIRKMVETIKETYWNLKSVLSFFTEIHIFGVF